MIILCIVLVNLVVVRVIRESFQKNKVVSCTVLTKLILIWIAVKAENEIPGEYLTNHQNINFLFSKNRSNPQCYFPKKPSMETIYTIMLKNLCVIEKRWYNEIQERNFSSVSGSESRREYKYDPAVLDTFEDRIYGLGESYKWKDCLLKQRNIVRPYPGNCYSKEKKLHEKQFKGWWSEVSGDIMYTFDFVLYNEVHRERKENQFWYLILYLKTLATILDNPARLAKISIRMSLVNAKMSTIRMYYALYLTKQLIKLAAIYTVKAIKKAACAAG